MAHYRGVHEARRGRFASAADGKAQPGKLTARLARLDHQRTLLQSQLAVWTEKQKTTTHRLKLLDDEIEAIGRQLRSLIGPRRATGGKRRVAKPGTPARADSATGGGRANEISLEY